MLVLSWVRCAFIFANVIFESTFVPSYSNYIPLSTFKGTITRGTSSTCIQLTFTTWRCSNTSFRLLLYKVVFSYPLLIWTLLLLFTKVFVIVIFHILCLATSRMFCLCFFFFILIVRSHEYLRGTFGYWMATNYSDLDGCLVSNDTWKLVHLAHGMFIVSCKMTFLNQLFTRWHC